MIGRSLNFMKQLFQKHAPIGLVFILALIVVIETGLLIGGYIYYGALHTLSDEREEAIIVHKSEPTAIPTISIPTSSIEPTTTQVTKAKLVSTNGWKNSSLGSLLFMVPAQATVTKSNCIDEPNIVYEECYLISGFDDNLLSPPQITIKTKRYQGGSRREEAGLTKNPGTYTYSEKAFSNNNGLEAVVNCKINDCTALRQIILVVKNRLIFVTDGIYKQGDGTTSLESPIANTILSTIN